GEWHMVTAPRAVLQCERAVERERQQDPPEGEFYHGLPRAHFLRPGYFHTATAPSAFSPYSHDLHFKGEGVQDQSPRDDGSYGCIPPSTRPHPLAQPGFYSPKVPRSKHCEPALSTTKTLKGCFANKNLKDFYSHTLPLPRSKIAVLKQSGLCSKPQGIKTSVVEKPRLMRAVISQISPDSSQPGQQQYSHQFQHIKKQDPRSHCFSSQHRSSLNHLDTEVSSQKEFVLHHLDQPRSNHLKARLHQSSFRVPKCAQDLDQINTSYMLPQNQSVDQPDTNLNLQSSCFCTLRLYNGSCMHTIQDSAQHFNNLKDLKLKQQDSKDRKDSSDVGNHVSRNISHVEVNSRNVFGQPRVFATLRAACSPRPARKNSIVEDLKKLIVMDDITDNTHRDSPSLQQTRPNSSLSEIIRESASSSPLLRRHALSRPSHLCLQSSPTVCQPMSAESAEWDRDLQFDHGLLPLPNTDHDLDWNSLVNAAEAYEMQQMTSFLSAEPHNMPSGMSPANSPAYSGHTVPCASPSVSGDTANDIFTDLPDQLSHLEAVLRRLSRDLLKEKKDKVALLAEVLKLRMNNQHLKEESWSANAQLHKICQIFNISVHGADEDKTCVSDEK
ncbi:hypothetical protein NFI96_018384, partial [Prochilodus magdalenae]